MHREHDTVRLQERTDMLTYCFESAYVLRTLARCKRNDLAFIDTDGISKAVVQSATLGTIYKSRNLRYYKHTDKYIHKEIIL